MTQWYCLLKTVHFNQSIRLRIPKYSSLEIHLQAGNNFWKKKEPLNMPCLLLIYNLLFFISLFDTSRDRVNGKRKQAKRLGMRPLVWVLDHKTNDTKLTRQIRPTLFWSFKIGSWVSAFVTSYFHNNITSITAISRKEFLTNSIHMLC